MQHSCLAGRDYSSEKAAPAAFFIPRMKEAKSFALQLGGLAGIQCGLCVVGVSRDA